MNLIKNTGVKEVIFIGLPGTTHHYGGLSNDNVASGMNRGSESSPKQAALQVIALARYLGSIGIKVGILPPQQRPFLPVLEEKGYNISDVPIAILEQVSSSSFMWAANAATVTPAWDSADHKLHLSVANLHTNPHRRIEAQATYNIMAQLFRNVPDAIVHPPLDAGQGFLDEGAANHMLLAPSHAEAGLHVFVYGKRQNLAASKEIAQLHNIPDTQLLFLEQNPDVISKGVFHNDVIAVSNENLLLAHERAYKGGLEDIAQIKKAYNGLHPGKPLQAIIINDDDLSVEEAVHSYFFNSQVVTKASGKMAVIAPMELQNLFSGKAAILMEKIRADASNTIDEVQYLDLRQSMRNGGGPACLRLRATLSAAQLSALEQNTGIIAGETMLAELEKLVEYYYPQTLTPEGLRDAKIYSNCKELLTHLSMLMRVTV